MQHIIHNDTIASVITPQGSGAVAVIRISGARAIDIASKIFTFAGKGKTLSQQKPNTIHYGTIQENKQVVDEVLLSLFKAPHSYTGEDSIEISCHASPYIQQKILQLIIQYGARAAQAGEFTMRAYFNNKLNLAQAEAVADLIAAESEASHRLAIQQLRGIFGTDKKLRDELLQLISLVELELDFSEEDVEFADRTEIKNLTQTIHSIITQLLDTYQLGNAVKKGVPVAIVGVPNTGKSTLLNQLLYEERAIVSDIAGTTRDTIEDTVNIEGIVFRFIDTAGIREATDTIEKLGIERTHQKIENASIILHLVDANSGIKNIQAAVSVFKQQVKEHQHYITLVNKIDILTPQQKQSFEKSSLPHIQISAQTGYNINQLRTQLVDIISSQSINQADIVITNTRHYQAFKKAQEATQRILVGIDGGLSNDLLAQDIRETLYHLGEITGETITTDEVLGNIFKHFCIGK